MKQKGKINKIMNYVIVIRKKKKRRGELLNHTYDRSGGSFFPINLMSHDIVEVVTSDESIII
jgi:hypothetical protein